MVGTLASPNADLSEVVQRIGYEQRSEFRNTVIENTLPSNNCDAWCVMVRCRIDRLFGYDRARLTTYIIKKLCYSL